MEHRTEAACLLETGALYRERVGLTRSDDPGGLVFAGFKQGAFSLYFGDEPIYHFDREGRWQRAFLDGRHYLKGLDGKVYAIDRPREGANMVLHRTKLTPGQTAELDERIRRVAVDLTATIGSGRLQRHEPPAGSVRPLGNAGLLEFLARIGRWDAVAWKAQDDRYRAIYAPLPFLPPECQNAVVVQATKGRRTAGIFVASPAGEPLIRTPEAFEQHTCEVAGLWGKRLLQARVVYLSDSTVLHQPAEWVNQYLEAIGRTFPIRAEVEPGMARIDGVHLFLDDFRGLEIGPGDWRGFIERGLVRLNLGVESGFPETRSFYQNAWSDDELRATVVAAKAAGLGISVLTFVGAGGVRYAEDHVASTARLLASLDLARGDFVFLLDENELGERRVDEAVFEPLRGAAWSDQQSRLKKALEPLRARGIKVLPYTMEKQWM
ncbi:MAG: hypothetical protein ACYC61_22735 [Isosphaeraceae bacterium]